ncbi:hypothetical protein AU894_18485 [Salmonella enterica subsp. enterica]|uniref:Uncharacterized protein n=1 Tax=Salmonella enterica subsp. enterica serovar Java TaxID=224729 RepID=A0A3Y9C2N0_SALEB|nr:hypothetical protein [Salmonella enterica subsp. enterica serovar Java]
MDIFATFFPVFFWFSSYLGCRGFALTRMFFEADCVQAVQQNISCPFFLSRFRYYASHPMICHHTMKVSFLWHCFPESGYNQVMHFSVIFMESPDG